MFNWLKRNSGFTLAEILVVLFIFSLIVGSMFTVLLAGENSWHTSEVRIELQQELRKSLQWITAELRQSGAAKIIGVAADGSWRNTITFSVPSGVVSGKMVWASEQVQYSLGGTNGKQLLRIKGVAQKVLANNIVSFQVRRLAAAANIVEIAIQAEKNTVQGKIIRANLTFKIKLRN